MPYNNFIVKNGITVNGSFTANSTVVNAAALNATSVNATSYTIASGTFYANSTTVNTANVLASTTVNIGANVVANTTTLFVGNTSVNTTITAGAVSINGTSIATMITGNAATAYANAVANSAALYAPLAGAVFTGQVNTTAINVTGSANIGGNLTVSGNLTLSGSTTFVNSTVITTTDKAFYLANTSTALAADGGGIYIGNNVASFLWNNATSSLQSNVALLPSTNNILLGGATNLWNLNANTVNAVSVIIGGTNVNSAINTAYSNAIANSAAMLTANVTTLNTAITGNAATAYANAVANTAALYQTTAGLSGNVAALTSNNSIYHNGVSLSTLQTQITSNAAAAYANAVANAAAIYAPLASPVFSTNTLTIGTATYSVANGNLGIGTSSPTTKLTVSGSGFNGGAGTFISTTSGNGVAVNGINAAGVNDSAYISLSDGTNTGFVGLTAQNAPGTVGSLRFGAAGTEYARIQPNGNVGIGTSAPAVKLDVSGGIRSSSGIFVNSVGNEYSFPGNWSGVFRKDQNGTTGVLIDNESTGLSAASIFQLTTHTGNSYLTFNLNENNGSPFAQITAGSNVAYIGYTANNQYWGNGSGPAQVALVANGNFGIGTNFPSSRLAVQASANNIDTFTVGASDFSHYFTIKPETSANTATIGYWNGTAWANLAISAAYVSLPSNVLINGAQAATQSYVTGLGFANATNGAAINGYNTATYNGYTGGATIQTPAATTTWAGYPIGYSAMISNSASGIPTSNYGYFYKISNRDQGGGWGGFWMNFDGSNAYYGSTITSGSYATWKNLLDSSNYNSYAPTLTGSGASGTWGISVTGSASSITGTYGGSLTSSQITTGLGYTPYNSTNPSGYITSSALSSYAALSGATFTGSINSGSSVSAANTNSSAIVTGSSFAVGGNGGNYLAFGQSTSYTQWIQSGYNGNTTRWAINLNPLGGNVGVNMGTNTDPSYNLDVNGKARVSSSLGVGSAAPQSTIGQIVASDNIIAYFSDARLKENIAPIPDALAKINTLSGVTYNSNDLAESYGYTDRSQQVGVLAQEVKVVMPQVIKPAPFDTDGEGNSISGQNYMTVQYEKLVPLLIEAIKELTAKVNDLESKLGSN